jgi:ABC-2 type transport system permease protein
MLRKELIQMRRDRMTFAMMLGIPAMQIVVFGFLVVTQVKHLPTVVLDESRTMESRALAATLENTQNFTIVRRVASRAELEAAFANGSAKAALVIPPEYARDLARGRGGTAQVIVDASDPMTANAGISGATLAASARSAELAEGRRAQPPPVQLVVRPRYNPALRDAVNIVPGLSGVILTITLVMIMSLSLVRERERGTLEQLIVTPIDRTSVILGKILPYLVLGIVQVTTVLVLARYIFAIPLRGSLALLYLVAFLFMLGMLALGLFLSTLARTQAQALQLALMIVIPSLLLSGFMFPFDSMPAAARVAGNLLPVTHFIVALRGILLKGAGLAALWPDVAMLTAVAAALVALSVARFAKTLE